MALHQTPAAPVSFPPGTEEAKEGAGDEVDDVVGNAVSAEVIRYQALFMQTSELDCKDVLPWWGRTGRHKFPQLAPVAQQVFGNQAAAAQVERDFSACGNLLGPNRSRIDTYWVEMVMFLKANFDHIPEYGSIPMIAAKDIRACMSSGATWWGLKPRLTYCTNPAALTTDDMGLNEG